MPQTRDPVVLSRTLDAQGPMSPHDAEALFRMLLAQVRRLHDAGRIHRALCTDAVLVGEDVVLVEAPGLVVLDGPSGDCETCPPEFRGAALKLPADMAEAARVLVGAGLPATPRRFDVYQLGALLLRIASGQTVDAFLRSPRAKRQVPEALLPAIVGALGFHEGERFADLDALSAALDAASVARSVETPPRGSVAASPSAPASASGDTPLPEPAKPEVERSKPCILQPPRSLGHYRILQRIGGGGMGDVYLAFEDELQRPVAIKVLPPELARNEDLLRRFLAEGTAIAKIAHPNVVPIYFIGYDAGRHYYAMQYVEGESLDRHLARRRRLPIDETLILLEQCLTGLQAVHQAGLIHRDIKPANILLDSKTGRALVADFGLVKSGDAGPTATGVVLGTVDYMAPEVARGLKADARCDLYAVGVMAYQMLSGRLPFVGETPTAVLFQHAYESAPPLCEAAPDVPAPVAVFVDRLMAKDPDNRFADSTAALESLRRCRAGEPEAPPMPTHTATPLESLLTDFDRGLTSLGVAPLRIQARDESVQRPWWRRLGARLAALASPRLAPVYSSLTVQNVDGAVARCEAHRERLARLLADAQCAAQSLARDKATTADLATAAELDAQMTQLRRQLAEADAVLVRLYGQRDLLKARLRVAQAVRGAGFRAPHARRHWIAIALLAAAVGGFAALSVLFRPRESDRPDRPDSAKVVPSPPGVAPAPSVVQPPRLLLPPLPDGTKATSENTRDDFKAAELVVGLNGAVDMADVSGPLTLSARRVSAKNAGELSKIKPPIFLTRVQLTGNYITDAHLEQFGELFLPGMASLNLNNTLVAGAGLRHAVSSMPYLRYLSFSKTPITDAGLLELAPLKEMRELSLQGTQVTDASMSVLSSFPELYSLDLQETYVSAVAFHRTSGFARLSQFQAPPAFDDSSMPFLSHKPLKLLNLAKTRVTSSGLSHLPKQKMYFRELVLDGTAVTDDGLEHVAEVAALTAVSLNNTAVTDEGLARLALLKLGRLELAGTRITDDGLKHLGGMSLLLLDLSNTSITGDGLRHLSHMDKLGAIWLSGTKVTDETLQHLAANRSLRSVYVAGVAGVTNDGVARLRKSLPNVNVVRTAPSAVVPSRP